MSQDEPGAALRRCTGLDPQTFAAAYWSKQLLLARDADGFADLLSPADIDELICERGLRKPAFRMVKAGKPIAGLTRPAAAGAGQLTDLVDPDAVREQYADGGTLVLQSLHRIHPPLVRFCRRLTAELGHRTQCNAYVTPPGSRGFAPHHDTHDVFVLQVDGYKRWHVYAPAIALPLTSQPSRGIGGSQPLVGDDTPPLLSVVLRPGDALYLPRGYIHAAETNDDRSIHLTVGVMAATAYDVLRDVLTLAADEPEFRQALPLGSASEQLAPVAGIVARAAQWLADLPAERLQDAVRARASGVAVPEALGMLATEEQLRQLDKETVVRPREDQVATFVVGPEADRVVLRLRDRELSLPAYVGPALQSLLDRPCRVNELALPVDDAVVLVRRLLREGVVTSQSI